MSVWPAMMECPMNQSFSERKISDSWLECPDAPRLVKSLRIQFCIAVNDDTTIFCVFLSVGERFYRVKKVLE